MGVLMKKFCIVLLTLSLLFCSSCKRPLEELNGLYECYNRKPIQLIDGNFHDRNINGHGRYYWRDSNSITLEYLSNESYTIGFQTYFVRDNTLIEEKERIEISFKGDEIEGEYFIRGSYEGEFDNYGPIKILVFFSEKGTFTETLDWGKVEGFEIGDELRSGNYYIDGDFIHLLFIENGESHETLFYIYEDYLYYEVYQKREK